MSARRLLLIRHARTVAQPGLEPAGWPLHPKALRAVDELAEQLLAYPISALFTSSEAKAVATGTRLGTRLSLEPRSTPGLHEHERGAEDFVASAAAFELQIGRLFQYPGRRVFGRESADRARSRFATAVDSVLRERAAGDVALVTHGTVATLFVAQHNPVEPLSFWRALTMPACVVLGLPGFELEQVITING